MCALDAILSRSNAGVIANLLYCLKRNVRCAVVGGTADAASGLLEDVLHVQQGKAGANAGAAWVPKLEGGDVLQPRPGRRTFEEAL